MARKDTSSPTTISFDGGTTTVSLTPLSTTLSFADTMTDTLDLTAGDTHEPVRARLFGPDGEPADLEDARVTFRMLDPSGEVAINSRATIDDSSDEQGWVRYDWSRTDAMTPGTNRARFVVRYPGGTKMHYPNGRPAKIHIRQP